MNENESSVDLRPLWPVLGRWRSSGVVLDEAGSVVAEVVGTDTYAVLPGGTWISHDVDVQVGEQRVLAHEVIGGRHPAGGWGMHAFDGGAGAAGCPAVMRLTGVEPGLLLLEGDGVRSWFRPGVGEDLMTTTWERRVDGAWVPWMEMRFERIGGSATSGSH